MKVALLLFLGLCSLGGAASADWQAELSAPEPGGFPALRPLHTHYKFGWSALTAAEATFDYTKQKGGLTRLEVNTKTTGAVRALWRLDARHVALMHTASLRPVSVRQSETYKDKTVKTKLDFTPVGLTRVRETIPGDGKPPKTKHYEYPNLFDLHSALQWVRSQPLRQGDICKLVTYPATTPYLAQVEVTGREKIKAAGSTWPAIKLDLKLWHVKDDLGLEPHQKFKRATIWCSDDANRVLLKIEAEIFVGSVWAELDGIEWK